MKICYISASIIPSRNANSIHVMKMCQAFAKNGHEVTLIFPHLKKGMESDVEDLYAFYGVAKNFSLLSIPVEQNRLGSLVYPFKAAKASRELSADLIFCRNLLGAWFSRNSSSPVYYESHAPVADSGRINEWIFKRMIRKASFGKLIVITRALRDYYVRNYQVAPERIVVAPDGADLIPADVAPMPLDFSGGKLQVGYIGHMYRGRGIDLIIEVANFCPWAQFNLVGGTQKDIDFWTKRAECCSNLTFHGFVSPASVNRYMLAFDVLLAPYQEQVFVSNGVGETSKWMSPLKVFEYMAAGKPIICSNLPVLREVFDSGRNAILCPADSPDAWAFALERLRSEPGLMDKIGLAARVEFERKYTWGKRAFSVL